MKKYFFTGLVILLPLVVTIWIVNFLVNILTKPFLGFVSSVLQNVPYLSNPQVLLYTSKILIIITLFLFTILLGMITRWFLFHSLLNLGDKILHRIPLVNKVYKTSQDIIKTLFASDKKSFKQVVMVPFPKSDTYVIGLVSNDSPDICSQAVKDDLVSVLIPTTPNPTTGFLLMYPRRDLVYIDMKTEDAVKYIVSCGVIIPPPSTPNQPTS